jgi:ribosomal-protein-serine acetyltransferase
VGFNFETLRVDQEIELRLLNEHDAKPLFALIDKNRRHLREWLPWLDMNLRVEDTMQFILTDRSHYEHEQCFNTGIWYRNAIVGVIGYHPIDWLNRSAMVGYWLASEYQGKGIMVRACRALTTYSFAILNLNRIDIRCATGNIKSCAIPKRLGFVYEGTFREGEWLYDHFVDLFVFSMLAKDWNT